MSYNIDELKIKGYLILIFNLEGFKIIGSSKNKLELISKYESILLSYNSSAPSQSNYKSPYKGSYCNIKTQKNIIRIF